MLIYIGLFLVTLSGLMFEIGLTRIFSATIWYHFAFVAISVALLGWGLGGFTLHLLRNRIRPSLGQAGVLTLLYAAAIPSCLWLIVRVPFHPDRLVFYFVVSLLPFLLAGMALSMVFALGREAAAQLYFADLLGASVGALAVTALLSWLGGENAVLAVTLAPLWPPRLASRAGCSRPPPSGACWSWPRSASTSRPASSRSAARRPRACTSTWPRVRARWWP